MQDKGEDIELSKTFTSVLSNSLFLNIVERTIFGPNEVLEQNKRINHNEATTQVVCRRSGSPTQREFSIEVGDNAKVAATMADKVHTTNGCRVLPMIQFSGKVTVSAIKYATDELCTGSKNAYNFESE
eukprot:scaffold1824_cov104-Skeletonema_dohrnii-CCMP3373.AAC.8